MAKKPKAPKRRRKPKQPPRTTLTEGEHYSGELLVMPFEGASAVIWCKGINQFSICNHYKACCVLGLTESQEEAVSLAEQMESGVRLPPEEEEPQLGDDVIASLQEALVREQEKADKKEAKARRKKNA